MGTATMSKKQITKWIHIAVILFLTFIFGRIVPPFGSVTEVGVKVLGPFLGMVYGWCTVGMMWPSIICMVGLAYSGLVSMTDVCVGTFGNHLLLFVICMLIIIENLTISGLTKNLALWLITRPFAKGHPWLLIGLIFFATYLLAAFTQAFAVIFLMWSFWYNICESVGYKPYSKFMTAMLTGTILGTVMGSLTMPFHQLPLVFLSAFSRTMNEPTSYFAFMASVIPFTILCILEYIIVLRFIIRLDVSLLANFDPRELLHGEEITFTKKQIVTGITFLVLIIGLIIPGVCPKTWFIVKWLNALSNVGWALLMIVVMLWIEVGGEPIFDFARAAKEGVKWDVIFFFGMIMYVPNLLTNEATGISPWIMSLISPIISSHGPWMFCCVLLIIGVLVTNIFNNTITGLLLMQIIVVFSDTLSAAGISPWAVLTVLLIAVNMAFWTPIACPTVALLYGNNAYVRKGDVFKLIFPTSLVWIATMFLAALPLANIFFKLQ